MPRLSIPRLIGSDYLAFSVVLYPLVLWAICIILGILDVGRAGGSLELSSITVSLGYIALVITVICLPLLGWRFYKLHSILKDGVEVPGKIKAISFTRDRGIVAYTYKYQGKTYQTRATLHKTSLTRRLQPEARTVLIVSKSDPRRAFIRDLYTTPSSG